MGTDDLPVLRASHEGGRGNMTARVELDAGRFFHFTATPSSTLARPVANSVDPTYQAHIPARLPRLELGGIGGPKYVRQYDGAPIAVNEPKHQRGQPTGSEV